MQGFHDSVGGRGTPHFPLVTLPIDEMAGSGVQTRLRNRTHDAFRKHRKDAVQGLELLAPGWTLGAIPSQFQLAMATGCRPVAILGSSCSIQEGKMRRADAVVKSLVHNLPPRHRSSPCRLPQAGASGFDEVQGAVGSLDRVRYRRMRFLEHEADPSAL